MSDTNPELDAIKHLIQVESKASELVKNASDEAEKRLSDARTTYNNQFKEKYDAAIVSLNEEYNHKIEEIKADHEKQIEDFKSTLENRSQNKSEFSKLLEKLLFA